MSLADLLTQNPKLSVVVVAFLITLIMTLITKKFTNQKRMKELKEKQKELQKNIRGDPSQMAKSNKEMMDISMELMKHSFKPMIFTLVPLLLFFMWLRGIYEPILSSWFWWYLGSGIISSIVLRKALKVV